MVPADADHTLPLLAYLNSPLISRFAERQAPAFRGEFFKFEPGVLGALPVLNAVIDNYEVMQGLAILARRRLEANASGESAEPIEMAIDYLVSKAAQSADIDLVI